MININNVLAEHKDRCSHIKEDAHKREIKETLEILLLIAQQKLNREGTDG